MKTISIILTALSLAVLVLVSPSSVLALTLDNIGASQTTNGNPGSQWWYTGANPTLSGTAEPSSVVTVVIDSISDTTLAFADGNWSYTPTTLTEGEHTVSITADGETIAFTLNIGQDSSELTTTSQSTSSASTQTLPVSGSTETTLFLMFGGLVLMLGGWKLSQR